MVEGVFKGQACAKFILLGEHFVAHGSPAIAFPIPSLYCKVQLQKQAKPLPKSHSGQMRATLKAALENMGVSEDVDLWKIQSQSNFSTSRGFGSSAAFSTALLRSIIDFQSQSGLKFDPSRDHLSVLQAMEKVFHSNPSGVDATTIWHEKAVFFQKEKTLRFISNSLVDFILIDSGERKNTSELVKRISQFRDQNKERWEKYSERIKAMAGQVELSLKNSSQVSLSSLAELIDEAHIILKEIQLSSPIIEEMITVAKSLGGLAGKVSGAGTGGATVILAPRGEGRSLSQKMIDKKIPVLVLVEAHDV